MSNGWEREEDELGMLFSALSQGKSSKELKCRKVRPIRSAKTVEILARPLIETFEFALNLEMVWTGAWPTDYEYCFANALIEY